jgi:hypothetical protein
MMMMLIVTKNHIPLFTETGWILLLLVGALKISDDEGPDILFPYIMFKIRRDGDVDCGSIQEKLLR